MFPPTFLHPPSPRQFHCKMAVAVATPDTHFDELLLVPPDSTAPESLRDIITEVPFDLDFGEIDLPSCQATETVSFR